MFRRSFCLNLAALAGVGLLVSSSAHATVINEGKGADTVTVLFNWPDGFVAAYNVSYGSTPADTIDVYDATQIATGDPNLTLGWVDNPTYGEYLNVASYTGGHTGDGDTYNGTTAPNNYWAEWLNDGSGWNYGEEGASFDTLSNGQEVGWVFGSTATPVPEPTSLAVLGGGALLPLRRRSRRR